MCQRGKHNAGCSAALPSGTKTVLAGTHITNDSKQTVIVGIQTINVANTMLVAMLCSHAQQSHVCCNAAQQYSGSNANCKVVRPCKTQLHLLICSATMPEKTMCDEMQCNRAMLTMHAAMLLNHAKHSRACWNAVQDAINTMFVAMLRGHAKESHVCWNAMHQCDKNKSGWNAVQPCKTKPCSLKCQTAMLKNKQCLLENSAAVR